MVKIGLSWLLLVVLKLTNREIRSDEILSFREVYDICRAEPSADVCDWLDGPPQQAGDVGMPPDGGAPEKRRQKAVFSSWGGKKKSGTVLPFSVWSGKRALVSRSKQSFTPWGGRKRADEPTAVDGVGYEERPQTEKTTDVGNKPRDDKKSRGDGYRDGMTNGVHALFTVFSDWSKNLEAKKGVRYAGLKSIRRNVDFFPWGGKRSGAAADAE